jgi:RNA polymerase sigma factor (sigma-70 family)
MRRDEEVGPEELALGPVAGWQDPNLDPLESAMCKEYRDLVRKAVAHLTFEQRRAIVLHLSGRSANEIAEIIGKRPVAVRMLLKRGRDQMRVLLSGVARDWNLIEDTECA